MFFVKKYMTFLFIFLAGYFVYMAVLGNKFTAAPIVIFAAGAAIGEGINVFRNRIRENN